MTLWNLVAPGYPPIALNEGGYSFANAEAALLVARFTTPPTDARKRLIDTLIGSLKTAGVWSKLDAFYMLAAADAQSSLLNWVSTSYNLTAVNSPTFTVDRGYTTNGTSSYLRTGFNPVAAAGQYTQNSAHMSLYSATTGQATGLDMGARTSGSVSQAAILLRSATDAFGPRVNLDTAVTVANADGAGDFVARRADAANVQAFRNGVSLGSVASVSAAMPNLEFSIGGANTGGVFGSFTARQFASASIGSSLLDGEVAALTSVRLVYLQAIGAA